MNQIIRFIYLHTARKATQLNVTLSIISRFPLNPFFWQRIQTDLLYVWQILSSDMICVSRGGINHLFITPTRKRCVADVTSPVLPTVRSDHTNTHSPAEALQVTTDVLIMCVSLRDS